MIRLLYILAGVGAALALGGIGAALAWASTALFGIYGYAVAMALLSAVLGGLCGWMIYRNRSP